MIQSMFNSILLFFTIRIIPKKLLVQEYDAIYRLCRSQALNIEPTLLLTKCLLGLMHTAQIKNLYLKNIVLKNLLQLSSNNERR
jgi:hypothetical protein